MDEAGKWSDDISPYTYAEKGSRDLLSFEQKVTLRNGELFLQNIVSLNTLFSDSDRNVTMFIQNNKK